MFGAVSEEATVGTYEDNLHALEEELAKSKPKSSRVKKLLVETFAGRRNWILKDEPTVSEVLNFFPLRQSSRVSCL